MATLAWSALPKPEVNVRRRLLALTSALLLTAGALAVGAGPARAADNIIATSVALNEGADCADADLDIGMDATTTDTETGLVTNLAGEVLGEFEQPGDWDGTNEVHEGYGLSIDPDQAEGTVIGSYASIGTAPLTSSSAVEWFVLYRCSNGGENVVIFSCFGDLGTCPTTAEEGAAAAFGATVSPTEVAPGGTLTVAGEGCVYPLAGAVLLRDGTGIGVGDVVEPNADGTFQIDLVVPAGLAAGPLTVQIDCGFDGQTVLSETVEVEVLGTAPPTAPPPVVANPQFTG